MSGRFWDDLEQEGDRVALRDEAGQELSYRALAAAADAFAARIGGSRSLVLIRAANRIASLVALIGCLRARHPVILSSDVGADRIAASFAPNVIVDEEGGIVRHSDTAHVLHDDLALMLSTSGSTGTTKLVRLSGEAVHANAASIAGYLGITRDDVPLTTLPIAYSYGLSVITSHLLCGARIVLTDRSVIDDGFWALFAVEGGTSLAGVPYTYELFEACGFRQRALPTLRTLTQAGGRIDPTIRAHYSSWAAGRGVRFFVMYGQTEATARIAYLPPELHDAYGDCIGRAIPGGALHVAGEDGLALPQGESGELVYEGPNVMMGYATSPADLALGHDLTALRTGDLAQEAAPGIFRIVGRLARFSKVAGLRISLDEIERLLASHGIRATVAGDDEAIAIALDDAALCTQASELIDASMTIPQRSLVLFAPETLPRLPSGKPDNVTLLRLAKEIKAEREAQASATGEGGLASVYALALNRLDVSPQESFASLGGDSLAYIEVSMAIERRLGHLPQHWETLSIAGIEQMAAERPLETPQRLVSLETEMLIRPIAMTTIVSAHVVGQLPGIAGFAHYWGGGALALLMTAGYNLCRFQKGTLLSERRADVPINYARRIVLPFYLIVLYKCLQWAKGGPYVAWSTFFLLDDYIRYPDASNFLIYWFIGALFQCILILTVLLSIRPVAEFARRSGYWFGLSLLAAAYAVKLAVHIALLPKGALMFPNNQLDHWAYAFALGWMVSEARTRWQGLACIALGFTASSIDWGILDLHTIMLTVSLLAILYVPRIRMSPLAQEIFSVWARATFFIYLTHGFAMAIMRSGKIHAMLGGSEPAIAAATVVLATIMGGGFYYLWREGERVLLWLLDKWRGKRAARAVT